MVPRATRSTVGFQLLDSQATTARIREDAAANSDPDHHSAGSTRALTGRPPVDVGGVAISFALIMEEIMGFVRGVLLWLLGIPLPHHHPARTLLALIFTPRPSMARKPSKGAAPKERTDVLLRTLEDGAQCARLCAREHRKILRVA
jgi:hypothetical protein